MLHGHGIWTFHRRIHRTGLILPCIGWSCSTGIVRSLLYTMGHSRLCHFRSSRDTTVSFSVVRFRSSEGTGCVNIITMCLTSIYLAELPAQDPPKIYRVSAFHVIIIQTVPNLQLFSPALPACRAIDSWSFSTPPCNSPAPT